MVDGDGRGVNDRPGAVIGPGVCVRRIRVDESEGEGVPIGVCEEERVDADVMDDGGIRVESLINGVGTAVGVVVVFDLFSGGVNVTSNSHSNSISLIRTHNSASILSPNPAEA